ncbi:MAG: 6-bladed beta-propeller [Niabella sp.]
MFLQAQDVPKIRIDPAKAYGGTVSKYFSDVEYIPLETTKESLFGDVNELKITDSSIIITDIDTKSLLIFSKTGRFLKRIYGKIMGRFV